MRGKPTVKTSEELAKMSEGGKKLSNIKEKLKAKVSEGVSAYEIEEFANSLIDKSGGKASFKMVEGYSWATCVNVNEGVVHGIPKKSTVFANGDIVSVDVGLFYKGFHTDTSFSVLVGEDKKKKRFLEIGAETLERAISKVVVGGKVSDVSKAIEDNLDKSGLTPVRSLVGHGVGRELHEAPSIYCYFDSRIPDHTFEEGNVVAVEVMYTMGGHRLVTGADNWTISTADGRISGLFEETVAVTKAGFKVLTALAGGRE